MLLGRFKLKTKILGVSSVFLFTMVVVIAISGFIIVKQFNAIGDEVRTASARVTAANSTSAAMVAWDRDIQALLKNH